MKVERCFFGPSAGSSNLTEPDVTEHRQPKLWGGRVALVWLHQTPRRQQAFCAAQFQPGLLDSPSPRLPLAVGPEGPVPASHRPRDNNPRRLRFVILAETSTAPRPPGQRKRGQAKKMTWHMSATLGTNRVSRCRAQFRRWDVPSITGKLRGASREANRSSRCS